MRRHPLLLVAAAMWSVACTGSSRRDGVSDGTAEAPAGFASYDPGAVAGGPGKGARYTLGSAASTADIARWDTDVSADGSGLPSGSGRVSQGSTLFATACASCHGAGGVGGIAPNPALVGRDSASEGFRFANDPKLVKTIGNYWPYAATLFDYIKRAMPLATPGSLSDSEVYALTAYILAANGIIPDSTTLDAAALRAVQMPYRDRFVPDDRTGGATVR